jgi:hypothetical protein
MIHISALESNDSDLHLSHREETKEENKQTQLRQVLQQDKGKEYLLNDGNIGGTFCIDKEDSPFGVDEQREETSGLLISLNRI